MLLIPFCICIPPLNVYNKEIKRERESVQRYIKEGTRERERERRERERERNRRGRKRDRKRE